MIRKRSKLGFISGSGGSPSKKFRQALQKLKDFDGYLGWSESNAFSHTLTDVIASLAGSEIDPKEGIELLLEFYLTDEVMLNSCDDSDGTVGDVYRIDACNLFVRYGRACENKGWIADRVLELYRKDDFGVRDELLNRAVEYLPHEVLCSMAETLWQEADSHKAEFGKRHLLIAVEAIARQLKDARLFEKARIAGWGPEPHTAACIDIAQAYLEAYDAPTALSWLRKIPDGDNFQEGDRDAALFSVFADLGMVKEQSDVAWRIFRRSRCPETLDLLLSTIGEHQRNRVVKDEIELLLKGKNLDFQDVQFILHVGEVIKAEELVLRNARQLDGSRYYDILPLADSFERNKRYLTTSILYRSLVDSILERGISKYYHHAVRYMKHLNLLMPLVKDWRGFQSHDEYLVVLQKLHRMKFSFWDKMGMRGLTKKLLMRRNNSW